ncbi:protein SFI1 homolog isoform X3 [Microtus oregoni]|uniref:protein SFI1 homolog isoform X3 n=1 Tax=Microtus oregoni TaxID=111838 RepID=UPI001BB25E4C|nr:protein SFI1 homolog isoform X3 [Microtus oregoni]
MEKKIDSRSFRGGVVKNPCSPKALPLKKSAALSAIQRELPRSCHPLYSHASQNWVQHRLRELRSRCVARKFLYLWIRMTFGRVTPSRARFFHERRILQKVFGEWREEWWVSQREWKLCLRADCHYRYYLYNLMFQNWKTFVQQRRQMRKGLHRAERHARKQKMRQAWKSWLIYMVARRTKLHMQTTALEFRRWSVLRFWWSKWRWQLAQAQADRALHTAAVKHRAQSLQLQAWSRWQEQLLNSQQERGKVVTAVRHHQCCQKQRSLKAWLQYLHICRVKRWQNEMAAQFHRVTVLQLHFCDWQWAWEWRQSLFAHQALVEKLAQKMALRRAFAHWKHYMLLQAEGAAQHAAAEEHHRHYLLHSCFRALKDNVTQARLWRIRRNLAHQLRDTTLLRRFWNLWQCQLELREERMQPSSLHAAWTHYRMTVLRKCVRVWLRYVHQRRCQQLLRARADGHFQQRALPAAFHMWYRLWRWRQRSRVLHTRAVRFHRETLEKQVFAIWQQKMSQHRENRLAERMDGQDTGCTLPLSKAPALVLEHVEQVPGSEDRRAAKAEAGGSSQSAHPASQDSAEVADLPGQGEECATGGGSQGEVAQQAAAEVGITSLEGKHHGPFGYGQKNLPSKSPVQQDPVLQGRLRDWFQRWQLCSQREAQQRFQLERAAQHHRQQLLKGGMARWKAYHLQCVMKKLLQRRAAQLLVQRLCQACFCQWRKQLAARKQEQWSTARALWFWAFSLQAKVWTAWLGFILERRRKKARQERAVQAYHQQLLQEGATRLLRFATGVKAFRQQLQARQEVQAAHSLHCAVRRCAELWKKKVLGPGRMSQTPAPITFSRRVTFKDSFLSGVTGEARDTTLETKKLQAPPSQGTLGSLAVAAGEPCLLTLNEARLSRKQPRRPSFLLDRLRSQRSPGRCTLGEQQLERPLENGQSMAPPGGLSLTRPFLPMVLPNAPGSKLLPTSSPGPELLPPSSFMPHGVGDTARVSAKPTIPRPQPALTRGPKPHLFLPGDFTSTGTGPGYGSEVAGHTELEAELEGIQQQLQHYQTTKQNLRSCQRQANSLRRWLELSQEEPRPEDWDLEQQVKKELEEVELQIQQLAEELQAQRQPIGTCIARVRALRQALC